MLSTVEKKIGFFILCNNDYSSVHKFDYRIQKSNTVRPTLYIQLLSGFFSQLTKYYLILNYFPIIFCTGIVFSLKKITVYVFPDYTK